MTVTVSIGGNFPAAYRVAEALEQEGSLARLFTPLPRPWLRTSLPRRWVTCLGAWQIANRTVGRLPWVPAQYLFSEGYDRAVARRVRRCDVFNGWCSVALHSMRRARELGARTVLQTGSAHIGVQLDILRDEYARVGIEREPTDPRVVRKGEEEYEQADHIVVSSSFARRTFIARGIDATKVTVNPEGVDVAAFSPRPKQDAVFRVLYAGRLEVRKGVHYLLDAWERLGSTAGELVLVGAALPEIRPILARHAGRFRHVGPVPHERMAEFYAGASVVVLPSIEDGWGHVAAEAMAAGRPVIVSENVGAADVVGQGGRVVPPEDAEALAEGLERFRADPALGAAVGRAAREAILPYTWNRHAARMVDLLRWMAGEETAAV